MNSFAKIANLQATIERLDQQDALSNLDALTASATQLEVALMAAGKTFSARPATDISDVLLSIEQLESHVACLRVSARLAGIETKAAPAAPKAVTNPIAAGYLKATEPKMTATAKCLAAKARK